jgi:hypothetical protein
MPPKRIITPHPQEVSRDQPRHPDALAVSPLTDQQRANVERNLLRVLKRRYPGRAISIDWNGEH